MSQIQKQEGIVIKKSDYKENASLITVLTKEGKLSLIVRGAKKINSVTRNYTNLFTKLDFNATNNLKLNTLTEALVISSYINAINFAYMFIDLFAIRQRLCFWLIAL